MGERRTYYEVLGVADTAATPEIRGAYHDRARALHPDVSPASSDLAGEMRLVNEAWRVLSDADARSAYDRELAELAAQRAPVLLEPEESDEIPAAPIITTDSALVAAVVRGWPLLVLGLIVAIFVFTAYATGDDESERPDDRTTGRFGWATGDCLVRLPVPTPVPCRQEHDAVVVAVTDDGAPCPDAVSFVADVPGLDQLCIEYDR